MLIGQGINRGNYELLFRVTDLGLGQNIFMAYQTRILYERDNAHNCEKF